MTSRTPRPAARPLRLALAVLLGSLGAMQVQAAALDRAREAMARGDLRAAQIEWRNAVRETPGRADVHAALAAASLEIGDGDTAEKEARTALERGLDPATGTALLVRAFLITGRYDALLAALPEPVAETPAGGQAAAGRGLALLALGQAGPAREAIRTAQRLTPLAPEPDLAAAAAALAAGDRPAAAALIDAVLARSPDAVEALLRKGTMLFEARDPRGAVAQFNRVIALVPGQISGRLRRAEAFLALDDPAAARRDIDAVLAQVPNLGPALYLRATLLARAQDWAGVEAALGRMGPSLGNFTDGYFLLAVARRGLGQMAQAEDAARRHLARQPTDPRGARLVAAFALASNRPEEAVGVLTGLAERGGADAESMDLLGQFHTAAGRPGAAVAAFQQAAALAPGDAGVQARLAAARLSVGDVRGTSAAAGQALSLDPARAGARELLALAALLRGDAAAAAAALQQLDPAARRGEAAGVIEGTIRLIRVELGPARASFINVLRDFSNSVAARMGLIRVAGIEGQWEEVERLQGEVLRIEPANVDAALHLGGASLPGAPRAAQARAVLQAAQAAAPGEPLLALTLANVMMRAGEFAAAARLLASEPLRARRGPFLPLARSEAHGAAGEWTEAEAAAREAVAVAPDSTQARRQLAALMLRSGDMAGAEALIQQGLRSQPGDASLQQARVRLVMEARGLDAALEAAAAMVALPGALPAARLLRGDLLMAVGRPEDAARAFAADYAAAPSATLALRLARAWRTASKPDEATAALRAWLLREPLDNTAQVMLSQLDIEAGRLADAERRLTDVVARVPEDAVALNNLAWLIGRRAEEPAAGRSQPLAERAFFLAPGPDTADTLGWILARGGKAAQALPLLRQAAAGRSADTPDPGAAYRLAFALKGTGAREEALALLQPALADAAPFPERAEAERLLAELRGGR